MGLFDFFFKKDYKTKDETSRVVTQAVDPKTIPSNQKAEDLVKLDAFSKKIDQSNINSNLAADVKPKNQEEEGLSIKNPFVGK